jgi:hypothetical protein
MKISRLTFALGLAVAASAAANATVYYVGTTGNSDLTSSIDLSVDPTGTLGGSYDADTKTWTWSASDTYILQEQIFIRNGTLVIEPGSIVRGQPRTSGSVYDGGALIIARGAKIIANGTADAPIVFTTASSTGDDVNHGGRVSGQSPAYWDNAPLVTPRPNKTAGLWGGLAILGNAPTNVDRDGGAANNASTNEQVLFDINGASVTYVDGTTGSITVSTDDRSSLEGIQTTSSAFLNGYDRFGGNLPNENSGTLRYVSIRHGGSNLASANELNGLTLGGVGAGTTVEYIEIWGNTDDGIEIFGGTVNLKHVAIFNPQDDGLDLDCGYAGTIQFILVVGGDKTDRLGEWDGSYESETVNGFVTTSPVTKNFMPLGSPTISNATFIGNLAATTAIGSVSGSRNDHSFNIRDQIAVRFYNSIFVNARAAGFEVDNRSTNLWRKTTARYTQGLAFMKGLTCYTTADLDLVNGGTQNSTAAHWFNRGSDDAVVNPVVGAAANLNTFNINPGLGLTGLDKDVSSGAALNLTPTNPQTAYFEDFVSNSNATLEPAFYIGAFDADPGVDSWLNGWSAADATNVVTKNGFGSL